ncbi:MAG: hypothetical protein AAGF94_17945 [Pseudomonadota bacterium]
MQRTVVSTFDQTDLLKVSFRLLARVIGMVAVLLPGNVHAQKTPRAPIPENQMVMVTPEIVQTLPNGTQFIVRTPQASEEQLALPVTSGESSAAAMVNRLYAAGKAAGLSEVLYDNRDARHSSLKPAAFPQLRQLAYAPEFSRHSRGLAGPFLFDKPVIGNASVALTKGPFRRSMPRLAMNNNRSVAFAQSAYANNQLYVYPEHRDHDPKNGDLFPAHLPYFVISQGSSYSDRPFMRALTLTYAAYPPETFDTLRANGLLASTTQMILRRSLKQVKSDRDYLQPSAHPTAFDKEMLRPAAMVSLASSMSADAVPPRVKLRVIEDLEGRPGVDFLARNMSQTIFTSSGAIARAWRSFAPQQRMVISAVDTTDPNERDLTFHWRVMRGNSDKISITPSGPGNSNAEIIVDWHDAEDLKGPNDLSPRRVEIAVFAHNGEFFSAPAFITIAIPVHQKREYAGEGAEAKLWKVDYSKSGQYVDPILWPVAPWYDRLSYGADGKIEAMTRAHLQGNDQYALIPDYPGTWLVREEVKDKESPARVTHRASGPPETGLGLEEIEAQ